MFQVFPTPLPDGILQLTQDFNAEPRAGKIDLGVGVYRNERGQTPVMDAVTAAEKQLLANRNSKAYLGLLGDVVFTKSISKLALGPLSDDLESAGQLAGIQTPGGSGALRLGFELIASARANATIWVPGPTWPNHVPVLTQAGLPHKVYPYYDPQNGAVDFDAMLAALREIPEGDVVLLHGCCHNPTGADLSAQQWGLVAQTLSLGDVLAFVDAAYQGFGTGLEDDAVGMRRIFEHLPEAVLTYSCSKNFGIYNERTGALLVKCRTQDDTGRTLGQMKKLARVNHSMPPDHGAAIVSTILNDADLRVQWLAELDASRDRIVALRQALTKALRSAGHADRFDHLADCQGMFSILGISEDQVLALRDKHAIYMPASSRVNVAGLQLEQIPALVGAISDVLGVDA